MKTVAWSACRTGHAPGHQRHPLGVRAEPLAGQVGAEHHDPAARQERPVRHGAVGRAAPLRRLGARRRFGLSARRQAPLHQTPPLRQGTPTLSLSLFSTLDPFPGSAKSIGKSGTTANIVP